MSSNTSRFDGRADNYVSFRPTYPTEILDTIISSCSLEPGSPVADIGSGTGIFSSLLLDRELNVYAVEPNEGMRSSAERTLANESRFHSISGSAEQTTLADSSVQAITAAQAFHWFDLPPTKLEMRRILNPGAHVALIWNQRDTRTQLQRDYESILRKHVPDYDHLVHMRINDGEIEKFLDGGDIETHSSTIGQPLDFEGLLGRMKSSSYVPSQDQPIFAKMANELQILFNEHERHGMVRFDYETKLFIGTISES